MSYNCKLFLFKIGWIPRGVVADLLACDIVVSEFELQSLDYVHFRTNCLGNICTPLFPPVQNGWRRSWTVITQECCEQSWTSPGGNTPQDTNCTATCLLSRKLSKLDETDIQDTVGEAVMYSYGSPHMAEQKQDEPARTYIQQLCEDTGCSPEDLPGAMNNREKWRERVRDIRATSTTWWWWWWWVIGWVSRVFVSGPGNWGPIPGRVIPKTPKTVLDAALLNTQHYKVWVKVKWSNPGKVVAPSPTPVL